jgi:Flp pilus assembly protein TadD
VKRALQGGLVLAMVLAAATVPGCAHLVLLHDPLTATEHGDLGVAYETAGERDLAAREYRHALRLEPHRARTRVNLGNVEAARGRWSQAESAYRRALRDSATDADAMNNLAVALLRRGRTVQAESLAMSAVRVGGERESLYRATLADVRAAPRAR